MDREGARPATVYPGLSIEFFLQKINNGDKVNYIPAVADLGGRPPPTAQNFLNFMQFSQNLVKSYVGAPPEGWRPSYGESWIRSCPDALKTKKIEHLISGIFIFKSSKRKLFVSVLNVGNEVRCTSVLKWCKVYVVHSSTVYSGQSIPFSNII